MMANHTSMASVGRKYSASMGGVLEDGEEEV